MPKLSPLLLTSALLLTACDKPTPPAPEALRPVKTVIMGLNNSSAGLVLPGEIRAHEEAALSFRVAGKVTACHANLGATIQRGQVLATLEPTDYQLAAQAGTAGVSENKAALIFAEAELARFRALRDKGFVSPAALEQKIAARDAAQAKLDAALASQQLRARQLDYTRLVADNAGIVTADDCHIGQVLGAGQAVLRLAQSGDKEVQVQVPESSLNTLHGMQNFDITLNAAADKTYHGTLRELAAAADPATRTYTAHIRINDADHAMQLGMSASVKLAVQGDAQLRLPLAAVVSRDGKTLVWKLDNAGVVHATAIVLGALEGNEMRVNSGLQVNDVVVTAGANLLRDGEKVKLLP